MQRSLNLLSLISVVSALTLSTRASLDDSLLLYAPFDGSVEAAVARGEATGTAAVTPEFRPGLRGQAVVIGGVPDDPERIVDDLPAHAEGLARNVYFDSAGNIDVEQGTVSFWLKPLDWSGTDGGFNVLFRTQAGRNFFMLYKFFHGERMQHLIGKDEKWTTVQHRIGHWQPGRWRHVAATWTPSEQRLFIDGVFVCARKVRFPLEGIEPVEPISVGPGGSWAKGFIGHSLVDEFRIHDRPLTDAEVIELYRLDADAALLDAGHVTVGKRTPTLDGRLEAFEYPLEATGFSDLRGLVAPRQSHYALSYDDENLYVAVRSEASGQGSVISDPLEIENQKSQISNHIELFLATDAERGPMRHLVFTPDGGVAAGDADAVGDLSDAVQVAQSLEDGVWTLEAAIPFAALGRTTPAEGEVWRFNLGRVFDGETYTSAAPVVGTLADRAKFMELRFRSDVPDVRIAGLYDMEAHQSALHVEARATDDDVTLTYVGVGDNINNPDYGLNTHRHVLFAEGRSTPVRAPEPPRNPWVLPDFQLQDIQVVERRNTEEQVLFRRRFVVREERLPMVTRFMYTLERSRLSVSNERRADGRAQARFLREVESAVPADRDERRDGDAETRLAEVWRTCQPIPEAATFFDAVFDLDFDILTPGLYTVKIDHVAPDGTETETYTQKYRIPGPDHPAFHPYVDPEADQAPAPWTPVEVSGFGVQGSGDGEHRTEASTVDVQPSTFILHPSSFQISTWGRTYGFGGGVLFDSLVTQDEELLDAPAVLRLDGEALAPVSEPSLQPGEASDVAAAFTQRTDLGALVAESRIVTHFDGYCEIEMTLIPPDAGVPITTLSLDIPLRGEAATLVRDGFLSPLVGSKSGAVGDFFQQRLVNAPFFWVGNDRVGFNWLAPDLEAWHSRRHDRNLELIRDGEQLLVRLNWVDTAFTLEAPRTFRFGFVLTPSRPLDRTVLRRREFKDHALWCQPWKYFADPDYDTADIATIERSLATRAEPGADQVFLYGGDFLSPFHPDWIFWEEEWRFLRPRRTYGEWTGDFTDAATRKRGAYTEACCESQTFRNFYLNAYRVFAERQAERPLTPEATGYYFDSGIGLSPCENAHHGCRLWTGLDGREYGRVSIDALRDIRLNLYRMLKRTGPDARVYYHQGFLRAMPMQHFADLGVGGEGVSGMISQAGGYYTVFTPESFRATFSPYIWGMKMAHLDMYVRNIRESNPAAYAAFSLDDPRHRRALMHSYGYCVVHDVDVYDHSRGSRPLRETIWAAQDALGWDEDVIFHPYWENDAVKRLGDDIGRIMASAYTKDGKMILVVMNDTDEDREVDLALDLEALGMTAGLEGRDQWVPERHYRLDETWRDTVPARQFRMIVWK